MENFTVQLVNRGWRSYITCGLCTACPKQDHKGCCHYSPRFYLPDLLYLFRHTPDLLTSLWTRPGARLDTDSLMIEHERDKSGNRCRFHTPTGCELKPEQRDLVCRYYLCPGIKLWRESSVNGWKEFWSRLNRIERRLNFQLVNTLNSKHLSLIDDPVAALTALDELPIDFLSFPGGAEKVLAGYRNLKLLVPESREIPLQRLIQRGSAWPV